MTCFFFSCLLFGGIPIVLGGDFTQIPPVIKSGTRSSIVGASIEQCYIWCQTQVLHLHMNMRVVGTSSNDIHFKKRLYLMIYNTAMQNAKIPLPQYESQTSSLDGLTAKVYSQESLLQALDNPSILYKSAILTSKNAVVDSINEKVLDLMPGEPATLISDDKADYSDEEDSGNEVYRVSTEYLQALSPGSFPPTKLTLKVGCILMLLRNLNPQRDLCNGTRLIVKTIGQYVLEAVVMKDQNNGHEQIEFIPRITLTTLEDDYPFILSRKQFPIKLSFVMTINEFMN